MPELGKKYECAECGTKFYDLGKPEPICPKCGTNQRGAAGARGTARRPPRARRGTGGRAAAGRGA